MNGVPIIRPTSCPTTRDLVDPDQAWALVGTSGRFYLGRLVGASDEGLVRLDDVFEYRSAYALDPRAGRVGIQVQIFVVELLPGVQTIGILPQITIRLAECSARELESLREKLVEPWEGRAKLRAALGGGLALAEVKA